MCRKSLVLDDLCLEVKENTFMTLLGPSGCGKTTTLRIIGGFITPDQGRVLFEGKDITNLPPNKRQLNTVFQKYALFPHMTVGENIAFGLKISGKSEEYIRDKIKYALKLVNMDDYANRDVTMLSGGQQQRIAIARAIVNEPKVLLLDEPLGALDLKLRQDMQYELIRLKNELGITFIYVTHDQEEALTMSDMVIRPEDVILGEAGKGQMDGVVSHLIFKGVHYEMEVQAGGFEWLVQSTSMFPVGQPVSLSVDPFNIQIMNKPESEDEEAVVVDV